MKKLKITDKVIKNVEYMVKTGKCEGVDCWECLFSGENNNDIPCHIKGFRNGNSQTCDHDPILQQSAKNWLAEHKEACTRPKDSLPEINSGNLEEIE